MRHVCSAAGGAVADLREALFDDRGAAAEDVEGERRLA